MEEAKKIESVAIDKLIGHRANPNRMSGASFKKLVGHIERTGNYEPIVVRPHPDKSGCFEIINGHHRVEALKQLGRERCDCVVWQVDDTEALLLVATLNRLCGSDELDKKSELIKSLCKRFSTKELVGKLAESRKSIERLKELSRPVQMPSLWQSAKVREDSQRGRLTAKALLNPLMFFLTDEQKRIVDTALSKATQPHKIRMGTALGQENKAAHATAGGQTAAQKRAGAIVKIAETFLRVNTEERSDYEG